MQAQHITPSQTDGRTKPAILREQDLERWHLISLCEVKHILERTKCKMVGLSAKY